MIRNSCVARGTNAATGFAVIYVVPDAHVFLMKDIQLANTAAGPGHNVMYLQPADGSFSIPFLDETTPTGGMFNWTGWKALNAGDRLYWFTDVTGQYFWVSGALLPYNAALV